MTSGRRTHLAARRLDGFRTQTRCWNYRWEEPTPSWTFTQRLLDSDGRLRSRPVQVVRPELTFVDLHERELELPRRRHLHGRDSSRGARQERCGRQPKSHG
ncbi:hypothetical protein BDA96_01G204900 [Sorghum bicolor]|nr:hypothetical protein BDA96_01G204900 [Sorghum bicolor]